MFIVDKFAGAQNLIDEMTIVTKRHAIAQKEETTTAPKLEVATTE